VVLILLLLLQLQLRIVEARCNRPEDLANGSIIMRRNFLRFRCYSNYILLGRASLTCGISGRLSGERPFCASKYPVHWEKNSAAMWREKWSFWFRSRIKVKAFWTRLSNISWKK